MARTPVHAWLGGVGIEWTKFEHIGRHAECEKCNATAKARGAINAQPGGMHGWSRPGCAAKRRPFVGAAPLTKMVVMTANA